MKLFEKLALTKKKMGKKGRKAWGGEMSKKGGWKETTKPDRQTDRQFLFTEERTENKNLENRPFPNRSSREKSIPVAAC